MSNFGGFSTKAAFDAAFPAGTYTFNLTGGTLGPKSVSVNFTPGAYPQAAPAFSPDTFNALTAGGGPDPALPLTITFSGPIPVDVSSAIFSISDGSKTVFSQSLSAGSTDVVVPENIFSHAGNYSFQITFFHRIGSGIGFQQFLDITGIAATAQSESFFLSFFN